MIIIHKGEMLDRIFNHAGKLDLSSKMRDLFVKNNLQIADLTELKRINENDYLLWRKMYKRDCRLTAFLTYTVLER